MYTQSKKKKFHKPYTKIARKKFNEVKVKDHQFFEKSEKENCEFTLKLISASNNQRKNIG